RQPPGPGGARERGRGNRPRATLLGRPVPAHLTRLAYVLGEPGRLGRAAPGRVGPAVGLHGGRDRLATSTTHPGGPSDDVRLLRGGRASDSSDAASRAQARRPGNLAGPGELARLREAL